MLTEGLKMGSITCYHPAKRATLLELVARLRDHGSTLHTCVNEGYGARRSLGLVAQQAGPSESFLPGGVTLQGEPWSV